MATNDTNFGHSLVGSVVDWVDGKHIYATIEFTPCDRADFTDNQWRDLFTRVLTRLDVDRYDASRAKNATQQVIELRKILAALVAVHGSLDYTDADINNADPDAIRSCYAFTTMKHVLSNGK